MTLNGALAGLAATTAEPLTPTAEQATLIGGVGGTLVVFILALDKLRIDDPVGAISVHGVVGIWGRLCLLNQCRCHLGCSADGYRRYLRMDIWCQLDRLVCYQAGYRHPSQ